MLKVENLSKQYENKLIGPFNFTISKNETIAIIGKSGSGKTTLVKLITNVLEKDTGKVFLNEGTLKKGDFTYISQIGTLFNHLTIEDNIRLTYKDKKENIITTLKDVNLNESFLPKYPFELSGGERQRVDLVRAIISNKQIMILDEAFSALDTATKDDIYEVLRSLRKKHQLIILIITHDLDEALLLGDKIFLLDDGVEVFYDTALNLLKHENEGVKRLINPQRLERYKKVYLDE